MPVIPTIALEQVICDWISSLGWDSRQELGFPLQPGPEIQAAPDRIIHITATGGPGYLTEEGSADIGTFQARTRGPADDMLGAQLAAYQLDVLILTAPFPATVDGVLVVHAHRIGGQPTALPLDPSDRRFEFTCNYMLITGV